MVKWGTLSQEKYKLLFIEAARVLRREEGQRYYTIKEISH